MKQLYKSHGSASELTEHLMTVSDERLEVSASLFVLGCLDLPLQHFLREKPRLLNRETWLHGERGPGFPTES